MPRELYSIICDDVRLETGNKTSLMGVYSQGIIVPEIPFTLPRLCLSQELDDAADVKKLLVHLRGPKLSFKAPLQLKGHEKERIRVRVCFGPVQFEEEGDYRFETFVDDETEPAAVRKFYVNLRDDLKIT